MLTSAPSPAPREAGGQPRGAATYAGARHTCCDVHELRLRLLPHAATSPLPCLRQGEPGALRGPQGAHAHFLPCAERTLAVHPRWKEHCTTTKSAATGKLRHLLGSTVQPGPPRQGHEGGRWSPLHICGCHSQHMSPGAGLQIVCRNCSRNKYPLKYLRDRMAKVCDGCFGELRKRGGTPPATLRGNKAGLRGVGGAALPEPPCPQEPLIRGLCEDRALGTQLLFVELCGPCPVGSVGPSVTHGELGTGGKGLGQNPGS